MIRASLQGLLETGESLAAARRWPVDAKCVTIRQPWAGARFVLAFALQGLLY